MPSQTPPGTVRVDNLTRVSSPHILRLRNERRAHSRQTAVERAWLDEQLIGKADGVLSQQEVSFGIIELKRIGKVDYDKPKSGPSKTIWLL